jgi:8-oxo-dGTP pyrophosphatase MutT (NUDIX family)
MVEPEAAVAIVRNCQRPESVLLMRRSVRTSDPWSGHWSFPGGRRDASDPDLRHTAIRELEEECGVRLKREEMDAQLPPREARRSSGPWVSVTPFLFRAPGELPAAPDGREAVETSWVPLDLLRDPASHLLLPISGMPPEWRFPAVPLGAVPLWGFTYRLITDWLGIGPKSGDMERAGFEAASLALEVLLENGLQLRRGWPDGGRTAEVTGEIPVAAVWRRFSEPGDHVMCVNRIEVLPNRVSVTGLQFEEYVISSV